MRKKKEQEKENRRDPKEETVSRPEMHGMDRLTRQAESAYYLGVLVADSNHGGSPHGFLGVEVGGGN